MPRVGSHAQQGEMPGVGSLLGARLGSGEKTGWFPPGRARAGAFCCPEGSCVGAVCWAALNLSFVTRLGQRHGLPPSPNPCCQPSPGLQSWQAERETQPWQPGRTHCLSAELLLPCEVAEEIAGFLLQAVPGQELPSSASLPGSPLIRAPPTNQ